jgi:hypothetical protein
VRLPLHVSVASGGELLLPRTIDGGSEVLLRAGESANE